MVAARFLVALLLPLVPALAYDINGNTYCEGPYALCAGAPCTKIAGNSTHVSCTCTLHNGLNTGGSSCAARANKLLSTYSIVNLFPSSSQPQLYSFPCTGSNAGLYANCIDAPCTTTNGKTTCVCPSSNGNNHYLGPTCPTTTQQTASLCAQLRSSGSAPEPPPQHGGNSSVGTILPQFYGVQPSQPTCSAPGS